MIEIRDIVVVLGHPHYYPRFGFLRAIDYGLANEYGASDAFMVLELKSGVLENLDGLVKYGPEFSRIMKVRDRQGGTT